jgi:hypothetical protein
VKESILSLQGLTRTEDIAAAPYLTTTFGIAKIRFANDKWIELRTRKISEGSGLRVGGPDECGCLGTGGATESAAGSEDAR